MLSPKEINDYKDGTSKTLVFFAGSCCVYDDPLRYFEKYLPDVRNILQFSEDLQRNGSKIVDRLMRTHSNCMCIHIRMTDFVDRNISTDMTATVRAASDIAKKKNISQFLIFGDHERFMRAMAKKIVEEGHWKANAVLISEFNEPMDLYVASRMCKAFLIAAVTLSFGWWLAFFISDQTAVYYLPDTRKHGDKVPSKELFLKSWQQYSG
ncbi:hypothetical protein Aduo_003947 [Ancylostoma duodenale]